MSDDSQRILILCVDDHPVVRQGIAGLVAVQPFRLPNPDQTATFR
jgi:hypothetical protein